MDLNRRDFSKLTAAAFGGLLTGTVAGCGDKPAPAPAPSPAASSTPADGDGASDTELAANFLTGEKHACRGLNMCKNMDKDGENACAGQGDCATIEEHACNGQNACKGQGGCGKTAGINECSGKGGCNIPMHTGPWERARAEFEKQAKAKGKTAGKAPPAS